jgi:hypothetical protein
MSINVTTTSSSASVSSTNSSTQVANAASSDVSKKSTDSFKDEMDKVSSSEKTEKKQSVENTVEDNKVNNKENKDAKVVVDETDDKNSQLQKTQDLAHQVKLSEMNQEHSAALSMIDMNAQLSNDIQQMVNNNNQHTLVNQVVQIAETTKLSGALTLDFSPSNVTMTQADAEFFVNLTQTNDVSAQNIVAQAQSLLSGGAEASQVKQSSQISQTLLNALMAAKENNQPLRIDFDQNVSVILRVGKDGALAANFIPGDKAVEQYLRNNIETLKNTFRENDLPYSDLSYSNRGSKQQKENRRNKQ